MHQPYYRSARTGAFDMPWARLHALKDYLDMVQTLSGYPSLHQTFNLVPSLVEQLEDYAHGDFTDTYWDHTLKPATELDRLERAFIVERMCERPDHPRARAFPRYLELATKREAQASHGWEACASSFSTDELRDLQIWFNLAWFDPQTLETGPLRELVDRGRDFREHDKSLLAGAQAGILARTLPAYREAGASGQVELTTSPYFHPILPLLANTDSARIGAPDTLLPPTRFAHPEDAAEQVRTALVKHERVFGETPRGMWCSEQAVGEDVLPILMAAGLSWTISDETVLARSLAGSAGAGPRELTPGALYAPYRLEREGRRIAMVFRDHTLSDLIGFAYRSWSSREAAADLLRRLKETSAALRTAPVPSGPGSASTRPFGGEVPALVTIALDGENAWEYYPRDGRDFLQYLYEGLSADSSLRCVTISEHLREFPPRRSLSWLHTGSWIGGDLRTWSGDRAHNSAWDALHRARDLGASRRQAPTSEGDPGGQADARPDPHASPDPDVEAAWRHILIAEGSDWFWWFGDHHHTELDHVWDLHFRLHLQEAYRLLGEPVPSELSLPLLEPAGSSRPVLPSGPLAPTIDGLASDPSEWQAAGYLVLDIPSTMQRSDTTAIEAVRFGWQGECLCLLIVPASATSLEGLQIEVSLTGYDAQAGPVVHMTLVQHGVVEVSCTQRPCSTAAASAAWKDVLEARFPLDVSSVPPDSRPGLVLHVGRGGMAEHVFHSAGLDSLGWGE